MPICWNNSGINQLSVRLGKTQTCCAPPCRGQTPGQEVPFSGSQDSSAWDMFSKRSFGFNVGLCSFWPLHQGRGEVCKCVWLPITVIVLRPSQCARARAVGKYCLPILQWKIVAYEQNESQIGTYSWKPQKPSVTGQPRIHINLKSNLCLLV